jgi:hypothetical protein
MEIAKAAKSHFERSPDNPRLNAEICKALRTIYFMPKGVLSLLKEAERGDKLSPERIEQALTDFNDREWKVQDALHAINFDRLVKELGMTLRTSQVLEQIRYGKMSLRQDIQNEVNYYGRRGNKPDQEKIRALIDSIEAINAQIEDIERIVNVRAKER